MTLQLGPFERCRATDCWWPHAPAAGITYTCRPAHGTSFPPLCREIPPAPGDRDGPMGAARGNTRTAFGNAPRAWFKRALRPAVILMIVPITPAAAMAIPAIQGAGCEILAECPGPVSHAGGQCLPWLTKAGMPGRRDNSGDVLSFYARSAPTSEMTRPHRRDRMPACIWKGALRNNDG